ncbi:MAG TPA: GNAT family N-acetyltransferase [Thermoplasmata archaeon]|nr:GNAT family N-acetyltransferase [Thermoplasmata archaeon]
MSVLVDDREILRPLLWRDRIRNATVIHRTFHNPDFALAFADQVPDPHAVLAVKPSEAGDTPHQFALHAADPLAAVRVLQAVPPGFTIFHLADELAFPAVKERLRVGWWGEAIYYRLDRDDFRDQQAHAVEPVDPKHAARIAKIWAPDWPAEGYVRSRIQNGLNGAIYEDGEPVAWYLTHLETDDVVMLGFLHVLDAYRRKGYARSLSSALIKATFAKGKVPCCHVYTDNEPSIRLMEGLGFKRVCLQAWGDGVARA